MDKQMKEAILEANMMLKELGLVIFTWGNVSGIDRKKGEVTGAVSSVDTQTLQPECRNPFH